MIVRGTIDHTPPAAGVRSEVERLETVEEYRPAAAVARQDSTGAVTPLPVDVEEPAPMLVRLVEIERRLIGGREVGRTEREWGWYNPRAALRRTPRDGEGDGPAPGGYHYTDAYLDAGGEPRIWPAERWILVRERRSARTYQGDRMAGRDDVEHAWHRRAAAVRDAAGAWIPGVGITRDEHSVAPGVEAAATTYPAETFGPVDRRRSTLQTSQDGAVTAESVTVYGIHSPRAPLAAGHPVRHDGRAQRDAEAGLDVVEERGERFVIRADRTIAAILARSRRWQLVEAVDGAHDYGGGLRSHMPLEELVEVSEVVRRFDPRGDGIVVEIARPAGGLAALRLAATRPPRPLSERSAATDRQAGTVEAVLDDPVATQLWGERVEVVQSDHLTSTDDAAALAALVWRSATAWRVRVLRPQTLARPGDTVLLIDPTRGLHHRALLTDATITRDGASATGEYLLEVQR